EAKKKSKQYHTAGAVAGPGRDAWAVLRPRLRDLLRVTQAPLPGHCACGMAFCFECFFHSGFWQYTTDEEETKIWYRADKPRGSGKNISKNV
ncbi:MAG: hypothetical protein LBS57_02370, partial [Treponema sp.]|nr:hypothetical protein [Treponema sp.]